MRYDNLYINENCSSEILSDSDRTKGKAYIRTGKILKQNNVLNDHIEFLLDVA